MSKSLWYEAPQTPLALDYQQNVETTPPTNKVKINRNGLGNSVVFAYCPGAGPVDLVSGAVGNLNSTKRTIGDLGKGYINSTTKYMPLGVGEVRNTNQSWITFSNNLPKPLSTTTPFTFSWWESFVSLPASRNYPAIFQFQTSDGANPFSVTRTLPAGVDIYESMIFGLASATAGMQVGGVGSDLVPQIDRAHRFVIVGRSGMGSYTLSDYTVYYDGTGILTPYRAAGAMGPITNSETRIGSTQGLDLSEVKLADVVLWNRVLSAAEIDSYFVNPYQIYQLD